MGAGEGVRRRWLESARDFRALGVSFEGPAVVDREPGLGSSTALCPAASWYLAANLPLPVPSSKEVPVGSSQKQAACHWVVGLGVQ